MSQNSPKPTPALRILVVDDESSVLEAIRMSLEFYGHSVTSCTSGSQALEAFKSSRFDVVVTDYAMPDLNGDELAAMIKAISPQCPIIMVTAHAEMLDRKRLAPIARVLSKPFLPQVLNEAITDSLRHT
jgi:CheY-like chemotaxis protein